MPRRPGLTGREDTGHPDRVSAPASANVLLTLTGLDALRPVADEATRRLGAALTSVEATGRESRNRPA
ncbi:hypothetical protein [Streptomyces albidoflavus]|uniref:hypothetical protein n=1 Tax=Streptomyces albidoflavus TaxID=1886 RepID=UPI0038D09675